MNDDMADFKITTNGVRGTIEVNGDDISDKVARCVIELGGGQPSRLGVELRPGMAGSVEGQGIVQVLAADLAQNDIILAWLSAIDSDALASQVLERQSLDGGGLSGPDPVATAMIILKEMAGGPTDRT